METIRTMVDRLMNKLGYYRPVMPEGSKASSADIAEMFKSYGENEMFVRLLRDLCAQDIKLYFQASNELDRNTLRGAWSRTNYFISLIQKSNEQRKPRQGSKRRSN